MNPGDHRRGLPLYLLLTFGFSAIFYFLIIRSGHIAGAGGAITTDTGPTKYVIGEFGAGLAITLILLAAYFWSRRGEVSSI